MRKQLLAASIVAAFILSAFTLIPVAGHFTLGDYAPGSASTGRLIHENDFDPHVPGPLAYVWPGSGLAAYTGIANGFPPGYQPPYPDGNPPDQPASTYQLESDSYSPFGAILTSTDNHQNTGSLIFALNFSRPCEITDVFCDSSGNALPGSKEFDYERITIYIPPEFGLSYDTGFTETTFSSDLGIGKSGAQDPIGPGWWIYRADGDIQFWPQHNYAEWYYIRINNVIAPKIAGKYFFKIFLWDRQMGVPGGWNTNSLIAGGKVRVPESGPTPLTVPVENWPVLLVKGELDPGVVIGTIRYGTFNASLYGRPINLPGLVRAVGTAIDPYTGVTTGRKVEARGYFNASAAGLFEVEGVAPGVYTIFASAAGYPEEVISTSATVRPGQSLHLDGYLQPGAVINGRIFSKHMFGDEAWPFDPRPVLVEIYNSNDTSQSNLVAWSPWNKTHAPYMAYDWPQGSSIPKPLPVAYPWDAVQPDEFAYYSDFFNSPESGPWISHGPILCGNTPAPERNADPCGKPDGVGPAQYWWVDGRGIFTNGGGPTSFNFQFGVKGVYGAPAEYDGHVPQPYATWINGLTSGRYWARAWINGYTQTTIDGVTTDQYPFEVPQGDWAGDISLPIDLHLSSTIVDTVHFHDEPNTTQECPISGCTGNSAQGRATGNRYLFAELRDAHGNLMGLNFTLVSADAAEATVQVNGFGMFGPDPNKAKMKFSYLRYQRVRDYGLPAGTYTIYLYMRGYLPDNSEQVSVTLSGNAVVISSHLYRGARFDVTANSIDWQAPIVERPWEFPGTDFNIYVYHNGTSITSFGLFQPAGVGESLIDGGCALAPNEQPTTCHIIQWDGSTTADSDGSDEYALSGFDPLEHDTGGFLPYPYDYRLSALNSAIAFETGTYSFAGNTYGYVQYDQPKVYAQRGTIADIHFDLLKAVNITVDIIFKKEGIITPTAFNMSMRVRVYNDYGNLVATAQTKTPGTTAYNSGQPLGIGRVGHDSGTYYVDSLAYSPSKANGLVTVNPATTGDTFLWHGTWNGITGWQAFDSDPDHDGIPDFSIFNPNYAGYTTWIPAGTDQVQVSIAGLYDTYGIDGRSPIIDTGYLGGWTIEVDTWNEYPTPRFDPTTGMPLKTNWYPPSPPNLEGLLEGDNFHTIPGDPAGAFGYRGNRYRANGLGPYAQRSVWVIPNARIGTEASAAFELDKRGFLSGNAYGFTWSDDLRTQSWVSVQATSLNQTFTSWTWDGYYDMYLDPGSYSLRVTAWKANQGYKNITSTIYVSEGQSMQLAFYLERSDIVIPELGATGITLLSVLLGAVYLVRRKSR